VTALLRTDASGHERMPGEGNGARCGHRCRKSSQCRRVSAGGLYPRLAPDAFDGRDRVGIITHVGTQHDDKRALWLRDRSASRLHRWSNVSAGLAGGTRGITTRVHDHQQCARRHSSRDTKPARWPTRCMHVCEGPRHAPARATEARADTPSCPHSLRPRYETRARADDERQIIGAQRT